MNLDSKQITSDIELNPSSSSSKTDSKESSNSSNISDSSSEINNDSLDMMSPLPNRNDIDGSD